MTSNIQKYTEESRRIGKEFPARYQLQLTRVNLDKESNEESKLRRFTFGEHDARHLHKTILLVGATGAGKTTLVNVLVNFVMGVEFEDKVWFEVVSDDQMRNEGQKDRPQSKSQTSAVSVYEVFGFEGTPVPFSLTIIDTPGYGDTEDEKIIQSLKDLFCIPDGVDTINAVSLVMKATENRLDKRTAYIFNSVTSLFGKDMEQNIVVMMTHSDGGKPKNALKALKDANIICARDYTKEPVYFQFNNRQNETIEDDSEEEEAQNAFKTSYKGMEKFTDFLEAAKPQSVKMTVEVMKNRIKLTVCVQNLKEQEKEMERNQKEIRESREELLRSELEMEKNKDFSLKETYKEKENLEARWDNKALTCKNCEENCHYPGCTWALIPKWCYVMKDGKCTSCSGKCPADAHVKEKWGYVTKTRTVTNEEKKAKFEENQTKKEEKTTLLQDLEKKKAELEQQKNSCLNEAFIVFEKLKKIALNEYVHLDFLIEKMNETGDTEKVQKLQQIRNRLVDE